MKLDMLKTATFAVEGVVVATCTFAATQIATAHGGSIWACTPIATIAAMESLRVPVAMHIPKLKLFGKVAATALLIGITPLTFEGMALAFEQFMHQRVVEVAAAQTKADAAQSAVDGAGKEADARKKELDRLSAEVVATEAHQNQIASQKPDMEALPRPQICTGSKVVADKRGRPYTVAYSYTCPDNGLSKGIAGGNEAARETHNEQLRAAQDETTKAHDALRAAEAAPQPDQAKLAADLQQAKADLELAKADSVMHRAAAAWFGVDVGNLTSGQFEVFKKWAMYGLAGATATVTMIAGFVSNMPRKDGKPGKVRMAWRAFLARRRKKLVRIVEKIKQAPPLKVLEIKYVPFDPASGRVINKDGSAGEFVPNANRGA
jgi:hypothetical protein